MQNICKCKHLVFVLPQHETDNPHDTHAIAIKRVEEKRRRKEVIVGRVPSTLSRIFHLFMNHGGRISVTATGKRRNKGLEIPATYSFQHKKPSKIFKLREPLMDNEDKSDKAA